MILHKILIIFSINIKGESLWMEETPYIKSFGHLLNFFLICDLIFLTNIKKS